MARDQEKEDSVYDFLYVDARRIALFNSQLNPYGHQTGLTRTASETETGSGGLNVGAAKLDKGSGTQRGQSRQFDTQWVAPLTFLDDTNKRGMLRRGLEGARIGQLVLAAGSLAVRDLSIIKRALALPSMRSQIKAQNEPKLAKPTQFRDRSRRDRNLPAKQTLASAPVSPQEFGLDFLAELPHALHASLEDENGQRVWCSLREDSLLVSAGDLFLKHGVAIAGEWAMVGVLDALPEPAAPVTAEGATREFEKAQSAIPQGELDSLFTLVTQGFGGFIDPMGPLVRMLLGRPLESYGMTPILIFREVSG